MDQTVVFFGVNEARFLAGSHVNIRATRAWCFLVAARTKLALNIRLDNWQRIRRPSTVNAVSRYRGWQADLVEAGKKHTYAAR